MAKEQGRERIHKKREGTRQTRVNLGQEKDNEIYRWREREREGESQRTKRDRERAHDRPE